MDDLKRGFLLRLLTGAGALWWFCRMPLAAAMGRYPGGVRRVSGQVTVNGRAVRAGDPVRIGDTVRTGPKASVIFVVEKAVFLLREDTRFVLDRQNTGESDTIDVIRLLGGKMLGVFSRRRREKLVTATAVTGIRGSAAYAEAGPQLTYLCTCYGRADIESVANPESREIVVTHHHDAPRFIDAAGRIYPGPVIHHTDAELILLESMVGRRPPFLGSRDRRY